MEREQMGKGKTLVVEATRYPLDEFAVKAESLVARLERVKNDHDDKDKGDKKEKEYYDPYGIWFFNKVKEKMPSISKGGEPKISNFFNKYGLSGKKVNENIERIKKLL